MVCKIKRRTRGGYIGRKWRRQYIGWRAILKRFNGKPEKNSGLYCQRRKGNDQLLPLQRRNKRKKAKELIARGTETDRTKVGGSI